MKICVGVVVMTLAFASIGCANDSASTELTKAEFIKRGDEICRVSGQRMEQQIAAWKKKHNDPVLSQRDQIENVIRTVALPPIREEWEQLAALEPPDDDQQAAVLVESFAQAVEEAEASPRRYVEGTAFSETQKLAKKYGFKECVSV